MNFVVALFGIADLLLRVALYVIIVQAILSWLVAFNVINMHNDFARTFLRTLDRLTEPLYRPFRKILPDFGGLDFSPMIVLLLIIILREFLLPATLLSIAQ